MHGKQFQITDSLDMLTHVADLTNPTRIGDTNPFLRQGRDRDGNRVIFIRDTSGDRQIVARIDRSAFGEVDEVGEFSEAWDADRLATAGIGPPPYHPLCRDVVIAVF